MKQCLRIAAVALLAVHRFAAAQTSIAFADSIRKQYKIPELAYAVVSADSVLELEVIGVKKANSSLIANRNDRFRIGSNTKAITGFIAAQLVKQGRIGWNTKFFDLFPELKRQSNPAYYNVTLLELLSFRTRLFPYTYTHNKPAEDAFKGSEAEQRYQFAAWFFRHRPVHDKGNIHFSNLGYVAAGMMLEKASGSSYQQLVTDLGKQLGIRFGFGSPNETDTLQPWGHDEQGRPEAPANNYKLSWLLAAGNINVSLPGYASFIRLQLQGLQGRSALLTQAEFTFLHTGLDEFSVGWFWQVDAHDDTCSFNTGNPGTFLTKVFVLKNKDRALVLFANSQSAATDTGLNILCEELKRRYVR